MSDKLKSTIEHIFNAVGYFVLIGAIGFLGQKLNSLSLHLFGAFLCALLAAYVMLPLMELRPYRDAKGFKFWGPLALYWVSCIALIAFNYFVMGQVIRAAFNGTGI